jgi:hypothetical protein
VKEKCIFFIVLTIFFATASISVYASNFNEVSKGSAANSYCPRILITEKGSKDLSQNTQIDSSGDNSKQQILDTLVQLNPNLNIQQIKTKIDDCKSSFYLMRSFVTSFYFKLTQDLSLTPEMKRALGEYGWIFGDAHPENFGILLNDKGHAHFTFNDYDDNAYAPLVWDLIRFLTSIKLNNPTENLDAIISSYRQGLEENDYLLPKNIKELLAKAEMDGQYPQHKFVDDKNEKIIRSKYTDELSTSLSQDLNNALDKAYGHDYGKIVDGVITERTQGGSGGLNRYQVLIKLKNKDGSDSKLVLIEFKEMIIASPAHFIDIKQPDFVERIQLSLKYTQGEKASRFYSVQQVGRMVMLMRPRFEGNIGISLDHFKNDDQSKLLQTEALLLGVLHSNSANNLSSYKKALNQVGNKELISFSQTMAEYFDDLFKSLK